MAQRRTLSPQPARQLVQRLAAGEEETFSSYVDRLAQLHSAALGSMLSRLGLITEDNQKTLSGYGVSMPLAARTRFAFVAGLSESEVENLLLSRFSPGAFLLEQRDGDRDGETVRKASVSEWAYFSGSHFCAQCLKDSDGIWSSRWKLPWSFACVKHRVMLHDVCMGCTRRPRAGLRDGRLYPAFHAQIPTPTQCNNATLDENCGAGKAGRPCGFLFTDLLSCSASPSILAAQKRLDDAMTAALGTSEQRSTAALFFGELRSVCALVMYASEIDDFPKLSGSLEQAVKTHVLERSKIREDRLEVLDGRKGPRQRTYIGVPTNAALMAAVSQKALLIVEEQSPELLRDKMQVLADQVRSRSPKSKWNVADYFQLSPRLRTALDQCTGTRGHFDRRGGARSVAAKAHGRYEFSPQHVAQMFPSDAFNGRFRNYFPNIQENLARRFCSMAALKLLNMTWSEAGEALELPASADRQANHMITQLNRSGHYDEFTRELHRWARALSAVEARTDYKARRDALRSTRDFAPSLWKALCEEGGITVGRTGSRSRYAAAWMWADATSGDWTLSPAFGPESTANQREVYKSMSDMFSPSLKDALRAEAQVRIARHLALDPANYWLPNVK